MTHRPRAPLKKGIDRIEVNITSPWAPTPRMTRPSGIDAKHVRLSFPTSGSSKRTADNRLRDIFAQGGKRSFGSRLNDASAPQASMQAASARSRSCERFLLPRPAPGALPRFASGCNLS